MGLTVVREALATTSVFASGKQTITFDESELGCEGAQTQKTINDFEKANPNIHVNILVLSPNSTTSVTQLEDCFIAGSAPRRAGVGRALSC